MNTKDRQHILDIVAADLDGREWERNPGIMWREKREGEWLDLNNLKAHPERYRIKQETVTVYLYKDGYGRYYSTISKNEGMKPEAQADIPIPQQEAEEIELVEVGSLDRSHAIWMIPDEPIIQGSLTGRKLIGRIINADTP
jgi:hypothetical protein